MGLRQNRTLYPSLEIRDFCKQLKSDKNPFFTNPFSSGVPECKFNLISSSRICVLWMQMHWNPSATFLFYSEICFKICFIGILFDRATQSVDNCDQHKNAGYGEYGGGSIIVWGMLLFSRKREVSHSHQLEENQPEAADRGQRSPSSQTISWIIQPVERIGSQCRHIKVALLKSRHKSY